MDQKMSELRREMDKSAITFGNWNASSIVDGINRQKEKKNLSPLCDTIHKN
jgi:hypothetical protein